MLWVMISCSVGFSDCRTLGLVPAAQCRAAIQLSSTTAPFICLTDTGEHIRSRIFTASK